MGGIDLSLEAVFHQLWHPSCMVDVGMRQNQNIHFSWIKVPMIVSIKISCIFTLEQTTIQKYFGAIV